uniref:Uncharacterized protein n=1 Tax=Panagrellus redivivus TaxID=6233 RepID=A0A7E4V8E9_PANRE
MDSFAVVLFLVCLAVSDVQGKVDLKKGHVERVSFEGDELVIVVDNSGGHGGSFQLCFASVPDASYELCPSGFTLATAPIRANMKTQITVNRQSQFSGAVLQTWEEIKFNEDKTLNITVAELPDARTIVTLENAEIFVPEKPKEDIIFTKKKSNASATTATIVAVVVVLILVYGFLFILFKASTFSGVIIGILVWFCVIRKPKSKQLAECDTQDDSPRPREKSLTPQNLSAKTPASISNTMTTAIQTTLMPKQIAHPSPVKNAGKY